MRTGLVAAAVLIFVVGLAHSVLGERLILMRLFRRPDLPPLFGSSAFTARTLRFAWHLTTVVWWGVGALLLLSAQGALTEQRMLEVIAATTLASGLIALVGSRGQHLAWLAFFIIGGLVWQAASTTT